MNLQMDGDRILVIGASEGIGYATALALAEEGATLSIASRRADAINHAADTIEAATKRPVTRYTADVTDAASVQALLDRIGNDAQALDALVIATGGSRRAAFEELSDEAWLENYTYNILGPVRLIRGLLPALRRGRHPRLLLFGAAAARMPYTHQVVSNVHKAGILSLTKTLAAELAPDGIRVNSICPGRTLTGLWQRRAADLSQKEGVSEAEIIARFAEEIPLKRFAEAREIADVAAFVLSPRASYLVGQSINVDGGIARGLL